MRVKNNKAKLLIIALILLLCPFLTSINSALSIYRTDLNTTINLTVVDSATNYVITFNENYTGGNSWNVVKTYNEPLGSDYTLPTRTGYNFTGNKGIFVATEIERFSQVSKSTYLSYGLRVEDAFGSKEKGGDMTSFLLSGGFHVCQPYNFWFWGMKFLGGVGEYPVVNIAKQDKYTVKDYATQLCFRTALQLSGGIQLGKGNTIYCGVRVGGHFGKSITFENFEDGTKVENLSGFDLGASLGYNFTF